MDTFNKHKNLRSIILRDIIYLAANRALSASVDIFVLLLVINLTVKKSHVIDWLSERYFHSFSLNTSSTKSSRIFQNLGFIFLFLQHILYYGEKNIGEEPSSFIVFSALRNQYFIWRFLLDRNDAVFTRNQKVLQRQNWRHWPQAKRRSERPHFQLPYWEAGSLHWEPPSEIPAMIYW